MPLVHALSEVQSNSYYQAGLNVVSVGLLAHGIINSSQISFVAMSAIGMINTSNSAAITVTEDSLLEHTLLRLSGATTPNSPLSRISLKLADAVAPDSLLKHTFVKLAVAGTLATITAISLLSFGGLAITAASVATLAGYLIAPTVAMHILELATAAIFRDTLTYSQAVKHWESWNKTSRDKGERLFEELVKRNYVPAFSRLRYCYAISNSVKKNEKASELLRKAAKKGDQSSIALLTSRQLHSSAIKKRVNPPADSSALDREIASLVRKLKKAAAAGSPHANMALYSHYCWVDKKESKRALKHLEQAAEKNHLDAKAEVARIFYEGNDFVKKDTKVGFAIAHECANRGDEYGMGIVIHAYKTGKGVKKNPKLAKWWEKQLDLIA